MCVLFPSPISDLLSPARVLTASSCCSYGGIVDDPNAPSPKELLIEPPTAKAGQLNWRKDVMDVLGKKGELEGELLRFVRLRPPSKLRAQADQTSTDMQMARRK